MKRKNPFVTKGYAGSEYFCDRVRETNDILSLLTNENNLALISPRRLGKTDLIRHCFAQPDIKDHYHTFVIDIYATNSLRDFVNEFGKAIMDDLKSKKRNQEIAYPRQIAMYLCRNMTDESLNSIGSYFGDRDHTTVLHGINKIKEDMEGGTGEELRRRLDDIQKWIKGE